MEEYRFKINIYKNMTTPHVLLVKVCSDGQETAYKWFNSYAESKIWCDLNGIDLIDKYE